MLSLMYRIVEFDILQRTNIFKETMELFDAKQSWEEKVLKTDPAKTPRTKK